MTEPLEKPLVDRPLVRRLDTLVAEDAVRDLGVGAGLAGAGLQIMS